MEKNIKKLIKEELNKNDVKDVIKTYLTTNEFKEKVEQIVKRVIKNDKNLEDKILEINKNVLTQLYKSLWVKRSFWRDNLSNKSS